MIRERSTGSYRVGPYFLAKSTSDVGAFTVAPILCATLIYWCVGLRPEMGAFFVFLLLFIGQVKSVGSVFEGGDWREALERRRRLRLVAFFRGWGLEGSAREKEALAPGGVFLRVGWGLEGSAREKEARRWRGEGGGVILTYWKKMNVWQHLFCGWRHVCPLAGSHRGPTSAH